VLTLTLQLHKIPARKPRPCFSRNTPRADHPDRRPFHTQERRFPNRGREAGDRRPCGASPAEPEEEALTEP